MFKNPKIYFINQEIIAEREKSIAIVTLCLRHKQTKLRSMPIWNPVSEYQPGVSFSPVYHNTDSWMVLVRKKLSLNSLTIRETHNRDRKKSSGQTILFNIWTIWAMDRGSAQPQVNLSLLCSNSLKLHPLYVLTGSHKRRYTICYNMLTYPKVAKCQVLPIKVKCVMVKISFLKTLYIFWNYSCLKRRG